MCRLVPRLHLTTLLRRLSALNDVIYSRWQWPYWDAFTSLFYSGRKWRVVHLFLQSMRNTQRLPDTAALTLLRLLKPHLLSLCEHFGGITQIFPHGDVDMWGRVRMSHFRGVWTSLNFDREYLFGFETLVFATSGIFSMHKQSKRKDNIEIASYGPFKSMFACVFAGAKYVQRAKRGCFPTLTAPVPSTALMWASTAAS